MRKKILITTIIVLVLSFFVIPGSYAIYRNILNSNGDIASAQWNVTLNQVGVNNYISVLAGDATSSASYTVNVRSISEVDIAYTIVVSNIPSGTSVALDNGSYQQPTNNQVIFNNAGTILYSDVNKTKTHTLTFQAASGATYVSNQEVNVDVIARQTLAH